MSRLSIKKDGVRLVFLEAEPDGACELCGRTAETRPYGPDGKEICFDCGERPENRTEVIRRLVAFLRGVPP